MMNVAGLPVVALESMLIACLVLGSGSLALAQKAEGPTLKKADRKKADRKKDSAQEQRKRAITRCRENRGVDCDTPEGLKEWIQQERPITDEERARAAGARRARSSSNRL